MPLRSWVWKHCLRADNGVEATCKICNLVLQTKGSTSPLNKHLRAVHGMFGNSTGRDDSDDSDGDGDVTVEESSTASAIPMVSVAVPDVDETPSTSSSPAQSLTVTRTKRRRVPSPSTPSSSSETLARPCSAARSELIDKALVKLATSNQLPISFVTSPGFRQFMQSVEPNYKVPSEPTFKNRLLLLYNDMKSRILDELSKAPAVSCSTDCWTSRSQAPYITVNVHFINNKWEGKTYTLTTSAMEESHTSANLTARLNSVLSEWKFQDKTIAIVSDNAANILGAIKNVEIEVRCGVSCLAHTVQLSVNKGLTNADISKLCTQVKKIVSYFHCSNKATSSLEEQQALLGLENLKLIQSCPTRWNSVYFMMERMCRNRAPVENVLAKRDIVSSSRAEQLEITESGWTLMEELITALKPLQVATTVLCGDSYTPISMVNPIIHSLINSHLAPSILDSENVSTFKSTVSTDLLKRFNLVWEAGTSTVQARQIAQFLDPRYKNLEVECAGARSAVRKHTASMCEEIVCLTDIGDVPRASSSALDFLFGVAPKERDAKAQFELYLTEPQIGHNMDCFKWWRDNEERFPAVAILAKTYLSIPATSATAERVFSTAGNIITAKRTALLPENVDMLVFMFQNRKVYT